MPTKKFAIKTTIWIIIGIACIIGLLLYWRHDTLYPSTDDAYVQANIVNVAAQVSGPIKKIYVENNQHVVKGQALLDIDPASFEISVQKAQAALDQTKQTILAETAAVASAQSLISAKASELAVAIKNRDRTMTLVRRGYATQTQADQAESNVEVAQAALKNAEDNLVQAKATLGNIGNKNTALEQATAALAQAQLDLQHTHLVAPTSGQLVNFNLWIGSIINAEQPLFELLDDQVWWVDANYKETQLERIHVGQQATIQVDMYPHDVFTGVVRSLSSGSGAAFSILPPENATGNWVKVTQRFPVRIMIQGTPTKPLRVGASAKVTINASST